MNERLRALLAAGLYFSGIVPVSRWWQGRASPTVTILNYHRATPGNLRKHLLYLRRHYQILPLEAALDTLSDSGAERNVGKRRPTLALTFDDGYADNYTVAAALAEELHVPITIFLATGNVRSGAPFWWTECERLVRSVSGSTVTIGHQVYRCGRRRDRRTLLRDLMAHFEHAETIAARDALLFEVEAALAALPASCPPEPGARPLTWAEVHAMAESGWVTFGAHTQQHPVLGYLADDDELRREVVGCQADLEGELGPPVRTFAYPVGKAEDIGCRARATVRQAGYRWALSTIPGMNTRATDPYLLRRIYTDPGQHWLVVAAQAAGVYSWCVRLVRGRARRLTHAPYEVRLRARPLMPAVNSHA
jgi:peptidoglycan/xylan/chitin deacetylase (PgdA/CDA1 family)